jgi:protein-S-isoprenylcysteine O-methyltransferase Ste14
MAFSAIWWLFPAASILFVPFSVYVTLSRTGGNPRWTRGFVVFGDLLGVLTLVLPFFEQPRFQNPVIRYAVGLPLIAVGLIGRAVPMIHLQRQGTTTAMGEVRRLVVTGPYRWVRHPQYAGGIVLLTGWFLVWGAVYSLCCLPLIAGIIWIQAWTEEKGVLEPRFGREYAEYRSRVGMLLPRIGKGTG